MALFAIAGEIITNIINFILEKVEIDYLQKVEVSKMPQKRFGFTLLLALLALIIGGFLVRHLTKDAWSYIDSFYYTFQVLTTIGYGDIYLKESNLGTATFIFVLLTASFGMGVTASLITSITTLIQTAKAGKRIRRISISRSKWKIPKKSSVDESSHKGKFTQYGFQQEQTL